MSSKLKFLAAIDQSTTGTKFILFDQFGKQFMKQSLPHEQNYSNNGWLDHNMSEIWSNVQEVVKTGMCEFNKAGYTKDDIVSLGITNQRETTFVWDRKTGNPLHQAIVWNDNRSETICKIFAQKYVNQLNEFKAKCGLAVFPYFSAFKFKWMLENSQLVSEHYKEGNCQFGTSDSWLIYKLTNGENH